MRWKKYYGGDIRNERVSSQHMCGQRADHHQKRTGQPDPTFSRIGRFSLPARQHILPEPRERYPEHQSVLSHLVLQLCFSCSFPEKHVFLVRHLPVIMHFPEVHVCVNPSGSMFGFNMKDAQPPEAFWRMLTVVRVARQQLSNQFPPPPVRLLEGLNKKPTQNLSASQAILHCDVGARQRCLCE